MIKYKRVYIEHYGYYEGEYIDCEICLAPSIDIHHLEGRGPECDVIENLIAVCRGCHNKCHDSKEFNQEAKEIHLDNLS